MTTVSIYVNFFTMHDGLDSFLSSINSSRDKRTTSQQTNNMRTFVNVLTVSAVVHVKVNVHLTSVSYISRIKYLFTTNYCPPSHICRKWHISDFLYYLWVSLSESCFQDGELPQCSVCSGTFLEERTTTINLPPLARKTGYRPSHKKANRLHHEGYAAHVPHGPSQGH
jgi:hypothetical protein